MVLNPYILDIGYWVTANFLPFFEREKSEGKKLLLMVLVKRRALGLVSRVNFRNVFRISRGTSVRLILGLEITYYYPIDWHRPWTIDHRVDLPTIPLPSPMMI